MGVEGSTCRGEDGAQQGTGVGLAEYVLDCCGDSPRGVLRVRVEGAGERLPSQRAAQSVSRVAARAPPEQQRLVAGLAPSRIGFYDARRWGADVVHLNDWQTGLVPMYGLIDAPIPPTVFAIHNLAYQGNVPSELLPQIGVPAAFMRTENGMEFFGAASFMKAGIALSDRLVTVSPTYAREIQTPEYGNGMDGLLRFRRNVLHGILNGIDVGAASLADPSWAPVWASAAQLPSAVRITWKASRNFPSSV